MSLSILPLNVPLIYGSVGSALDISTLIGEKTVQLDGSFDGQYVLYVSNDGLNFVPEFAFEGGRPQSIKLTLRESFLYARLRCLASNISSVTAEISGVYSASANAFTNLPAIPPGAYGPQAPIDLFALLPPTGFQGGSNVILTGDFQGSVSIEGSLDGIKYSPIAIFRTPTITRPADGLSVVVAEHNPVGFEPKVRYLRANVLEGAFVRGVLFVTVGGEVELPVDSCNYVSEPVTNGEANTLLAGEVVRISGNNQVSRARADLPGNVAGLVGVEQADTLSGTVGDIINCGRGFILLEPGLTPLAGDTLYVSPTIFGRATNVAPIVQAPIGTIKNAAIYGATGGVIADIHPGFIMVSVGASTLAAAYAAGSIAADQTMTTLDANGGGIVVDGTDVGFTGAYGLSVEAAFGGVVGFKREGGISILSNVVRAAAPGAVWNEVDLQGSGVSLTGGPATVTSLAMMKIGQGSITGAGNTVSDAYNLQISAAPTGDVTFTRKWSLGTVGSIQTLGGMVLGGGFAAPGESDLVIGAGATIVSEGNSGRLGYLAGANQSFMVSMNGGAYVPLLYGPLATGFTPGSIPFAGAGGQLTEDNADLFWDNTNKRLGVGLNIPGSTLQVNQPVVAGAVPTAMTIVGGAHTTITAGSESIGANLNFSATKTWSTGAIASQREVVVQAPTYAFVGASTITQAATFAVTGAPVVGANAIFTQAYAAWIQSGELAVGNLANTTNLTTTVRVVGRRNTVDGLISRIMFQQATDLGGAVAQILVYRRSADNSMGFVFSPSLAGGSLTAVTISEYGNVAITPSAYSSGVPVSTFSLTTPPNTGITASSEAIAVNLNCSSTKTWATGALTTQREVVIQAPTYDFAGASTITSAATFAVSGAPNTGANATITRPWSIWAQTGAVCFGASVAVESGIRLLVGDGGATTTPLVTVLDGDSGAGAYNILKFARAGSAKSLLGVAGAANALITGSATNDFCIRGVTQKILLSADAGATAAMIIATTNNIGMGVAPAASSKLHVVASQTIASASGAVWDGVNFATSTATITGVTNITTATGFNFTTFAAPALSGTVTVSSAATVQIAGPPTISGGGSITSPASLVVASGRTGLGTNTPGSTLEVATATNSIVTVSVNTVSCKGFLGATNAASTILQMSINRDIAGVISDAGKAVAYINLFSANLDSSIRFHTTSANNVDATQRMIIDKLGNVGIAATPAASSRLQLTASYTIASAAGAVWDGVNFAASTASITGNTGITTATGFNLCTIATPTIVGDTATCTIDKAASLTVLGPPTAGANITIATPLSFWSQAGRGMFTSTSNGAAAIPLIVNNLAANNGTATGIRFSANTAPASQGAGTGEVTLTRLATPFFSTFTWATHNGTTLAGKMSLDGRGYWSLGYSPSLGGLGSSLVSVSGFPTTGLTAGTENPQADFDFSQTRQWATGAIAAQREFVIRAPTYSFVGASTVTTGATLAITDAPIVGANATITRSLALWVQAGATEIVPTATVVSAAGAVWDGLKVGAATLTVTGATTPITALSFMKVDVPTVSAASAVTVTDFYTMRIAAAAFAGAGPASATRSYSLFVEGNLKTGGGLTVKGTDINAAGPYNVLATDQVLQVRYTLTGTISINFPAISTVGNGRIIQIIDSGNNSGVNAITVVPNGADKINFVAANYTINVSGSAPMFISNSATGNWELC
jgi:hypothetical protein